MYLVNGQGGVSEAFYPSVPKLSPSGVVPVAVIAVCKETYVIFCSNLKNDQDMITALGPSVAVPLPLFTDCCFSSVDNELVCIERKKVGDMAQCVNDGRFLNQMITCKENGADYLFLVLEGRYRRNPEDGVLEIPVWVTFVNAGGYYRRRQEWVPVKPFMQFSRFDQYLTELSRDAGIVVKHSENVAGTVDVVLALYQNFQKPGREHQSLKKVFKPNPPTVQLVRPSLVQRVASELPGIGWERSKVVAEHFPTVLDMVRAGWEEWADLDGIGKKTAQAVVKSLGSGIPEKEHKND